MSRDSKPTITLHAVMRTDVGMVRDHNEDNAHVDGEGRFFIVADGMGGHAAGEVASAMAVEEVRKSLETARAVLDGFAARPSDSGRRTVVGVLEGAVRAAHQSVYQRGVRESDKHGMGTTLDVVVVTGPEAFVAHVGDSRTYLVRDGKAAQITTDHTVAEVLVIEGKLSIEEAQTSPLRTILVNAVGVSADVGVEMAHVRLRKNDRLLLCSDGLHDYFPVDQELADELTKKTPEEALLSLVELAKHRGGHDNITGVVVEVVDCVAPEAQAGGGPQSDGIPHEVGAIDTMPVDTSSQEAPTVDDDDTLDPDEPRPPRRYARRQDPLADAATPPEPAMPQRRTEPMRVADPVAKAKPDGKAAKADGKADAKAAKAAAASDQPTGETLPRRTSAPVEERPVTERVTAEAAPGDGGAAAKPDAPAADADDAKV